MQFYAVKKKKNLLLILSSITMISCATQNSNNQSQVIIDPTYNYLSDKSFNKMALGTLVYFKVENISNNKVKGYLLNNIFNVDDNIILFKMGDSITADYNSSKTNCGLINVVLKNSNGYSAPITDFYLMKEDITFNCSMKSQIIKSGDIYNLNITSVSNIPNIPGGVQVPNIYDQFTQNQLDTEKQYKIISSGNLNWIPISVADNGIQTIIKLPSGGGAHLPYAYINNKLIPINSSFSHSRGFDYTIIDGIYSNIVLNNLTNESFGEIHILRKNLPDTQNTIVNNLFSARNQLIGQTSTPQQNVMYQPISNDNTNIISPSSQSKNTASGTVLYKQTSDTPQIVVKNSNQNPPLNNLPDDSSPSPMGVNIMGRLNFNNQ